MNTFSKAMKLWSAIALMLLGTAGLAQAQQPAIFFTDLTSGPASGGEGGAGAYVTVYGNFLGSAPGSVTVGGVQATNYKVWGSPWRWYQKLTFQIPTNAAQGATTVQVKTAAGASNTLPFTVRSGNIYCVSTSGSDTASGKFPSCWRTILKARDSMAAGDTTYLENGVSQTGTDNYNASLAMSSGGTSSSPMAFVAYPGATVTIGTNTMAYGVRTPSTSGSKDNWVLAGLTLRGLAALDLAYNTGWRVVGNDLSCPDGSGQSACMHTDTNTNLYVYGNYVHNVGDQAGSIDKYFHAVYFTTNTNHVWVGYNEVAPNPGGSTTSGGCRAIQFYSTGGSDQYDLHVFNNLVHDAICDGINFATVNPDQGVVEAYNNVVYHVGTGPDPADGSSNYSCVLAGSSGNPKAAVKIYNNTFSDCGGRRTTDSGAIAPDTPVSAVANIVYQLSGESFVNSSSGSSALSGSSNIWYGVNGAPAATSGNITADPLFVNLAAHNFALQSKSPAVKAAPNMGLRTDFAGYPRSGGFDIGARAYVTGSAPPAIACDLNSDGLVNSADVLLAVGQATGSLPCTNADLGQTGVCNVLDIQRVVNASLGGVCRTGQ